MSLFKKSMCGLGLMLAAGFAKDIKAQDLFNKGPKEKNNSVDAVVEGSLMASKNDTYNGHLAGDLIWNIAKDWSLISHAGFDYARNKDTIADLENLGLAVSHYIEKDGWKADVGVGFDLNFVNSKFDGNNKLNNSYISPKLFFKMENKDVIADITASFGIIDGDYEGTIEGYEFAGDYSTFHIKSNVRVNLDKKNKFGVEAGAEVFYADYDKLGEQLVASFGAGLVARFSKDVAAKIAGFYKYEEFDSGLKSIEHKIGGEVFLGYRFAEGKKYELFIEMGVSLEKAIKENELDYGLLLKITYKTK